MKKLILLIFLLLLPSLATAALTDNLDHYYSHDGNRVLETNLVDELLTQNGTLAGVYTVNKTGKINEAINYTGSGSLSTIPDYFATNFTISFWMQVPSYDPFGGGANPVLMKDANSAGNREYTFQVGGTGTFDINVWDSGNSANSLNGNAVMGLNTWNFIVVKKNGTTLATYVNGTLDNSVAATWTPKDTTETIQVFGRSAGNYFGAGRLDELSFWSRSLELSEIQLLYNSGIGNNPFAAQDTLNITNTTPNNNSIHTATNFSINATVSSTTAFNISLYINSVLNQSVSNQPSGSATLVKFNFTFPSNMERNFTYHFMATNTNTTENSSHILFFIDNVLPNIIFSTPNSSNNSIFTTLTTNITITDPNLYSYYYNLTRPNGSVVYNISNSTLTGLSTFRISDIISVSQYGEELIARVTVCDGHTAQDIKDYKGNVAAPAEVAFDIYGSGVQIFLEDKSKGKQATFSKKRDRYTFEFKTKSSAMSQSFIVTSAQYIEILHGRTEYAGHLVTGSKWIDFESETIDVLSIDRIDDYTVRVNVFSSNPTDMWAFESVGELNCVQSSTKFFALNNSIGSVPQAITGESVNYTLNVSYSGSYVAGTPSATFHYNGTSYAGTASNRTTHFTFSAPVTTPNYGGDRNVSYYWTYTINGVNYNTSNVSQQVYNFDIDNCTTYLTQWINFTIRNETNDAIVTGDASYVVNYGQGGITRTYSSSRTSVSNFALCLYPPQANLTGDIEVVYTATNFEGRSYINASAIINNITDYVNLYLLSSILETELTITVKDFSNNLLSNILIEMYRYDVATNTDILVETEITDSQGQAVFSVQLGTTQYRFKFYQGGTLALLTDRYKIVATSQTYQIGLPQTTLFEERVNIFSELTSDITYTNASRLVNFSYVYTGDDISQFCMNVTDFNQTYFSGCRTASTANITYTITRLNISYIATAYAYSTKGDIFVIDSLAIDTRNVWQRFGTSNSIIISYIITLTLSLIGVSTGVLEIAIASTMVSYVLLYWLPFSPITKAVLYGIAAMGLVLMWIINRRRA